ncbi:MAG TPA: ATP-binding cassette domain-containing protein [Candidatus Blautia stercoravium]|nr:ATP-binding cassette domain-containing protein [Candidatus Blautia stercoravium]
MAFLSVKNIVKKFETQTALNNVNVEIEKGELVSILGPSGCGKTTLLRIIAGLETPDMGQVFIDGKDCTPLPPSKRNFGIVFQSYALFPHMTVEQNLMFGLNQQKQLRKDERKERTREMLEMVDLYDHRKKYPSQLSGGQQQRIALARALSLKPAFLLLDEPLSALDAKVRIKLRAEIRRIQKKLGITTILVTHDQEEALTMADKIVVMNNAVIEQVGTPKEIYNMPKTAFTANFIGTMNLYQQDRILWGVRPEAIGITRTARASDQAYHKGMVEEIEFRGALTRVYGRLKENQEVICADMDSRQAENLLLKEKEEVFFYIPQSGTICYPSREAAERNTA